MIRGFVRINVDCRPEEQRYPSRFWRQYRYTIDSSQHSLFPLRIAIDSAPAGRPRVTCCDAKGWSCRLAADQNAFLCVLGELHGVRLETSLSFSNNLSIVTRTPSRARHRAGLAAFLLSSKVRGDWRNGDHGCADATVSAGQCARGRGCRSRNVQERAKDQPPRSGYENGSPSRLPPAEVSFREDGCSSHVASFQHARFGGYRAPALDKKH